MYCKLSYIQYYFHLHHVLIVAKCIVNAGHSTGKSNLAGVLIVAKCIVNLERRILF